VAQRTPLPPEKSAWLREKLIQCFDEEELRTLCSDLGVDYDRLRGEGLEARARELVAYLGRRGRIHVLIEMCIKLRPDVDWEETTHVPPPEQSRLLMPLDVARDFVDRTKEMARFQRMLAGETTRRILCILERGEQGKSYFLLRLFHECEQQRPPVPVVLLDFDQPKSGLTDCFSVARQVRRHLGDECTPAICACEEAISRGIPRMDTQPGAGDGGVDFGKRSDFTGAAIRDVAGRDLYQNVSFFTGPPTPEQVARQKEELGRALRDDLARLDRAVVLVDTFEHASEETRGWLERWLFEPLRRELCHVILVVAGRPECRSFFAQPCLWSHLIDAIDRFTPFSDDDILAHFRQRGLTISEAEVSLLQIARMSPAKMAGVGDLLEQAQGGGMR
jgi:hypothetical protein